MNMKCKWRLSKNADYNFQSDCGCFINYESIDKFKDFKYCPLCGSEFEYEEMDASLDEFMNGNIILFNRAMYEVGNNLYLSDVDYTDEVSPIFITKQIFKKINVCRIGNLLLEYDSFDGVGYALLFVEIDGCVKHLCKIYTVHEFQNMYRLITGCKLEVNL